MSYSSAEGSRSPVLFAHRTEAGERLAAVIQKELAKHAVLLERSLVVYGLPRGGVVVAEPIAQRLGCPLSVVVAKKITRPDNPELAIGAVTAEGEVVWSPRPKSLPALPGHVNEVALHAARQRAQVQWEQLSPYCPPVEAAGAIALIVDDGIATGMTMMAAAQELRTHQPAEIWLCVPVAPAELLPQIEKWGDRVIVLAAPSPFQSVSRFYREFAQVEMEQAIEGLQRARVS